MKSNSFVRTEAAFTLTELCVVIVCVAVVGLLVLPVLGSSKGNSQGLRCMENTRRLTMAWRMYAEDNSDLMVYSCDDGTGTAPYHTTVAIGASADQGNLYAWTWSKMDFTGSAWNWDTNADITLRPLWQYVKDASVYKCPADASTVIVAGASAGSAYSNGNIAPRIRSYSMNIFLGGFGNNTAMNSDYASYAKYFPVYLKLTELGNPSKSPGPGQTFVFICERSDVINWGNFETDMTGYPVNGAKPNAAEYDWNEDLPSSYHDFATPVSFADGHAELHRWTNPSTSPSLAVVQLQGGQGSGSTWPAPYSQDVAWMQNVSARPH